MNNIFKIYLKYFVLVNTKLKIILLIACFINHYNRTFNQINRYLFILNMTQMLNDKKRLILLYFNLVIILMSGM